MLVLVRMCKSVIAEAAIEIVTFLPSRGGNAERSVTQPAELAKKLGEGVAVVRGRIF